MNPALHVRQTPGASVIETGPQSWRFEIPAGQADKYRWAQLDDHLELARKHFPCQPPLRMELRARVSAADLPGTWGFGLWNDPFSASFGISGAARRLPALPNAAWFFYAGRPNYLAFRDTHPAEGFLAATFSAPHIPALVFAPGILALPLLALPATARLLRRLARLFIQEDGVSVPGDVTGWHTYRLDWLAGEARFHLDDQHLFTTRVSPRGPLGLVIWIDNQYAAFPPSGKLRFGTSPNPEPAWLEIEDLKVV
jgi:hypothetical protein